MYALAAQLSAKNDTISRAANLAFVWMLRNEGDSELPLARLLLAKDLLSALCKQANSPDPWIGKIQTLREPCQLSARSRLFRHYPFWPNKADTVSVCRLNTWFAEFIN